MPLHGIASVCVLTLLIADAAVIQKPNPNDKSVHYRLPNHTRPLLYDLKLNLHLAPDNFTFDGEVLVDIEILNRTRILTLHSKNLMIDENVTHLRVKTGFDFYIPVTYDHNNLTESLSLGFDEELPIGYYILYLRFVGALNDKPYGFYRSSYTDEAGNTVWFAGTNFIPTHARAAFPCWDEPALKATFKIAIKHRYDYTAISNMPVFEVSEIDEDDGKVWTYFGESPVMSTYLVGFLVSDFRNISNSDDTINVWARSSAISSVGFAHEVAQKAAIELERYTNGSIRVPKVDHVALPGLSNKEVQSWGLVTYREAMMLYKGNSNPIEAYKIADSITFQSIQQWFGNVVTPSWNNVWLNGGIIEYLKHYIIDKIYENWQFKQFFLVRVLHIMLFVDSTFDTQPLNMKLNTVDEISSKFHPYSYENRKASLFLRMLSHCLTEEVFHAGLIKYLNKHKYSVAEPEDLWSALQDALDESTLPKKKFNVQEVMDTWIGQKGYPLVTVIRDQQTGKMAFTQESFRPYENFYFNAQKNTSKMDVANTRWWIPINFATRSNPDFSSTVPTAWLSQKFDEFVITNDTAPQDWVIVNIQRTGFYSVNYDATNWLKIADYLDSENYLKVHALNRAQIISDAMNLMFANKLDPEIFMNITRYLRRETDYTVWNPLFVIFEDAIKFFAYNNGGELLKLYILDLMTNIVESLSVHDRPDDNYFTKITRYEVLERACACGHPMCLREAHAQLIAYLENPTEFANSTSFQKKQWIFCNGVKLANESVWYKLLYMYTEHSEPTAIDCLGHSKNLTIIENFLNMTISEDFPIPKQYVYRVFGSILAGDYPNIEMVIDFTTNHWDKLTAIYSLDDATDLLHHISWSVVSKKQIRKIKTLMEKFDLEADAITAREHNIDLLETIVNKIRLWLTHRNPCLSSGNTP
ncbi:hypothetical protein DMN91_001364 [Ooceraea biroi]|uniref:Aminopeptidase n=2 Tax=Ooceraea biroi TaxID=2015173 RepID=A0A3L8E4A1_OOCBI|nr:aminopeptidase N-like isoform X2 [Ooceraea biroi]RLU27560.1 hypothetical protein DMN91_001364 [Ooceraea biroi]